MLLATHIDCEKERDRFMTLAGKRAEPASAVATAAMPQKSSIAAAEVDRLGALLTPYLGPISAALAHRESTTASSLDELQQRLADLIPNERERAHFLRESRSR
jgi:hypothetical protein